MDIELSHPPSSLTVNSDKYLGEICLKVCCILNVIKMILRKRLPYLEDCFSTIVELASKFVSLLSSKFPPYFLRALHSANKLWLPRAHETFLFKAITKQTSIAWQKNVRWSEKFSRPKSFPAFSEKNVLKIFGGCFSGHGNIHSKHNLFSCKKLKTIISSHVAWFYFGTVTWLKQWGHNHRRNSQRPPDIIRRCSCAVSHHPSLLRRFHPELHRCPPLRSSLWPVSHHSRVHCSQERQAWRLAFWYTIPSSVQQFYNKDSCLTREITHFQQYLRHTRGFLHILGRWQIFGLVQILGRTQCFGLLQKQYLGWWHTCFWNGWN